MKRTFSLLLCLLLGACNLPGEQTASVPQAWFDMPLPDTVFYPPNPCHLIAHGASASRMPSMSASVKQTIAVLMNVRVRSGIMGFSVACYSIRTCEIFFRLPTMTKEIYGTDKWMALCDAGRWHVGADDIRADREGIYRGVRGGGKSRRYGCLYPQRRG